VWRVSKGSAMWIGMFMTTLVTALPGTNRSVDGEDEGVGSWIAVGTRQKKSSIEFRQPYVGTEKIVD